jgi:tungstate transport system substrate-binding protein
MSALGQKRTWRHGSLEENQSTFLGRYYIGEYVSPKTDTRVRSRVLRRNFLSRTCSDAREIDCRHLDHLDERLRFVRTSATNLYREDRHCRESAGSGYGQALDIARRGEADVIFVHAKSAEQRFVAEGYGVKRYPVMYNDFVLIGPKSDPAGVKDMKDVAKALKAIKDNSATFISRGDNSGTHMFELMLWNKDVGINIQELDGPWYRSAGRGMHATLHKARVHGGYALSDRGTWNYFENKGDLQIMVEGDKRMFNQYGVILVNPDKHPKVQKELGQMFIDWLISPEGQRAIADYKIDGKQLFFPNATDPNA